VIVIKVGEMRGIKKLLVIVVAFVFGGVTSSFYLIVKNEMNEVQGSLMRDGVMLSHSMEVLYYFRENEAADFEDYMTCEVNNDLVVLREHKSLINNPFIGESMKLILSDYIESLLSSASSLAVATDISISKGELIDCKLQTK